MTEIGDELPPYTVRRSSRARHARITVSPRHGVVVVIPTHARGLDPQLIVRERAQWIQRALDDFAQQRQAFQADAATLLPQAVHFAATQESWPVEYRLTGSSRVTIRQGETLTLSGAVHDAEKCIVALQRWLQARAVERLLPRLAHHSAVTGISYSAAGVRGQHSRWGGCSGRGTITLNRSLLFLPPELMDSVMLHELAHRIHPNHSQRFWAELERLDPQARLHRVAIRSARDAVPAWAERR